MGTHVAAILATAPSGDFAFQVKRGKKKPNAPEAAAARDVILVLLVQAQKLDKAPMTKGHLKSVCVFPPEIASMANRFFFGTQWATKHRLM